MKHYSELLRQQIGGLEQSCMWSCCWISKQTNQEHDADTALNGS